MSGQLAFLFAVPAARTTDPDTAHEAIARHSASGARSTNAERVLAVMRPGHAETFRELALRCGLDPVEVQRRLNDLRRAGLVVVDGMRVCSVAQRRMQVWRKR